MKYEDRKLDEYYLIYNDGNYKPSSLSIIMSKYEYDTVSIDISGNIALELSELEESATFALLNDDYVKFLYKSFHVPIHYSVEAELDIYNDDIYDSDDLADELEIFITVFGILMKGYCDKK